MPSDRRPPPSPPLIFLLRLLLRGQPFFVDSGGTRSLERLMACILAMCVAITSLRPKGAFHGIWASLIRPSMSMSRGAAVFAMLATNSFRTKGQAANASAPTSARTATTMSRSVSQNRPSSMGFLAFCLLSSFRTSAAVVPDGCATLAMLEETVAKGSVCDLPGCPMKLDVFVPLLKRAQSRGYVMDRDADYVLNGFTRGLTWVYAGNCCLVHVCSLITLPPWWRKIL